MTHVYSAIHVTDPCDGAAPLPSELFLSFPSDETRTRCLVDCVTPHVAEALIDASSNTNREVYTNFNKLFSWASMNPGSGTNLYKARFIRHIEQYVACYEYPLERRSLDGNAEVQVRDTLTFPGSPQIVPFNVNDPSQLRATLLQQRYPGDILIIPEPRNQPTWDLCCYVGGRITMIKATTSRSDSFSVAGLDTVRKYIAAALPGTPPSSEWSITFVAPRVVEEHWTHAIPITYANSAKNPSFPAQEDYPGIRQYVAAWPHYLE